MYIRTLVVLVCSVRAWSIVTLHFFTHVRPRPLSVNGACVCQAYVQVFDYEWHDYERVADLFELSRAVNPLDRPNLVRFLSLARHNCALVDGELQFPG